MSDDSEQVTALFKELLIMNREENTPTIELPTMKDVERRKDKRRMVRQELVRVLDLRDGKKS